MKNSFGLGKKGEEESPVSSSDFLFLKFFTLKFVTLIGTKALLNASPFNSNDIRIPSVRNSLADAPLRRPFLHKIGKNHLPLKSLIFI